MNDAQPRTIEPDPTPGVSIEIKKTPIKRSRFPISEASRKFLKRFYPGVSVSEWSDWRWQLQHRIRNLKDLSRFLQLSADEKSAIERHAGSLPLTVTPYYLSLFDEHDALQGIRRTHIPVNDEYLVTPGEDKDPLSEDGHTVVPGLVHRYPDRVLFLTTGSCSTYCRYCTRSRMVGGGNEYSFAVSQWEKAAQYIEAHPEIRDCLLSGGDPLTIVEDKLDWLLTRLRAIPHLEFIRIGTKAPVVLPQRITPSLIKVLKRHRPWLSVHFTHPDELTPEVQEACRRLADAGLPIGSQTVLLKGVNDEVAILKKLFHGLLKIRVRPYYLYQCDPVQGSSHFRTPVEKGLEMIKGLRGHTTGYAVPTFIIDAPGGGGKIPLLPDYIVGRENDDLLLMNYENEVFRYPDPNGLTGQDKQGIKK